MSGGRQLTNPQPLREGDVWVGGIMTFWGLHLVYHMFMIYSVLSYPSLIYYGKICLHHRLYRLAMATFLRTIWPHLVSVRGARLTHFTLSAPSTLVTSPHPPHPSKTSNRRLPILSLLASLVSTGSLAFSKGVEPSTTSAWPG